MILLLKKINVESFISLSVNLPPYKSPSLILAKKIPLIEKIWRVKKLEEKITDTSEFNSNIAGNRRKMFNQ